MFKKFLLRDTAGKKSTTLTAFVLGFITVNIKLLASGLTIAGYQMSAFSGVDYAAALAALGGVYILRRDKNISQPEASGE
jgi:hypothetical protein